MLKTILCQLFIVGSGGLSCLPAYAAFVRTQTPTLTNSTIIATPFIAKPQISQVQPLGCVHRGDTVTIIGSNFGTGKGEQVGLISNGSSIGAMTVSTWTPTRISATVPDLTGLQAGQNYAVGIAKVGQSGWLSNTDKSITLCQASQSKISISSGIAMRTFGRVSANSSNQTQANNNAASSSAIKPSQTGGSLLQGQLPPPPQDISAPPPKDDNSIEPRELLVLSDDLASAQAMLTQAQALGFGIKRRSVLKGLGFVMTVLRVPDQLSSGKALMRLRAAMPKVWADVNHRYRLEGLQENNYGRRLTGWKRNRLCRGDLRIGLLDTLVASSDSVFRHRAITQRSFLASGIKPAPRDHATAIAALLVAAPQSSGLTGLLPQAHLYVAGIFRKREAGNIDTTAEWMVRGLNWLVQQKVKIMNLSLGGPRNLLVEAALKRVMQQGVAVVAAAGNGGRQGSPVYPGAQPGVLAVTAVDARGNVYNHATHGKYIALSAPGVDIWTARANGRDRYVSGTSYAVPFVTAALANAHLAHPRQNWPMLTRKLEQSARDLGKPGRDSVFGWGLVQFATCHHSGRRRH